MEEVAFAFERDRVAQAPESCGLGTANLISDPGELVQEHSPTFPTGIRNRLLKHLETNILFDRAWF